MPTEWWCSGFFGGSLWYIFEQTKDPQWKAAAEKWTMAIQKEQYNKYGYARFGIYVVLPIRKWLSFN